MCPGAYSLFRKCIAKVVWRDLATPAGAFLTLKPNPERIGVSIASSLGSVTVYTKLNGTPVPIYATFYSGGATANFVSVHQIGPFIQGELVFSVAGGGGAVEVQELCSPKDFQ